MVVVGSDVPFGYLVELVCFSMDSTRDSLEKIVDIANNQVQIRNSLRSYSLHGILQHLT